MRTELQKNAPHVYILIKTISVSKMKLVKDYGVYMTQKDNYNELVKRIKNKKIVITQSTIWDIAGSEIVTLELATTLKRLGADVLVFT